MRARFLQRALEAQQTVLPDNLDPLFFPWGHALPDPAQAGRRLDLVRFPELVDSLGLAYRWYLQCSTMTHVDTVLFGVPAGRGR